MKIVIISECKIRELPIVEKILLHYPGATIIQPIFTGKQKSSSKTINVLGKKILGKIHRKILAQKLYPGKNFPKLANLIKVPSHELNTFAGTTLLQSLSPDILITCRAPLLKNELIEIPKWGAINVHYGIAPHYRGNDSLFWALYHRDYEHLGGCIHYLSPGVDTGNILAEVFPPLQSKDGEALLDIKTTYMLSETLVQILRKLETEQYQPTGKPQATKGKNYKSKDRTFGKSLQFIIKKRLGLARPGYRDQKINAYY